MSNIVHGKNYIQHFIRGATSISRSCMRYRFFGRFRFGRKDEESCLNSFQDSSIFFCELGSLGGFADRLRGKSSSILFAAYF